MSIYARLWTLKFPKVRDARRHARGHPAKEISSQLRSSADGGRPGRMIYLDRNATTPVLPRDPARDSSFISHHSSFSEEWGNPSSACKFGSKPYLLQLGMEFPLTPTLLLPGGEGISFGRLGVFTER